MKPSQTRNLMHRSASRNRFDMRDVPNDFKVHQTPICCRLSCRLTLPLRRRENVPAFSRSRSSGLLAHDRSRARNLQVCVPGTYIRIRRRASPFFRLWLPQRCHTVDRSGYRQIRFLPALRASLRTEGHRQFTLSKDRYRVTHPPAPASHWRYRRTAAFHQDAESATTQRKFASCPRRD